MAPSLPNSLDSHLMRMALMLNALSIDPIGVYMSAAIVTCNNHPFTLGDFHYRPQEKSS